MYIHIPFCKGKCSYCSFYSIPVPTPHGEANALFDSYLRALLGDIASHKEFHGVSVDTVYFGGGTPTLFGHHRILTVLSALKSFFRITPDAEISIECNPSDLAENVLLPLVEAGINRVTVGIQTFHEHLRRRIGRIPAAPTESQLEQFMRIFEIVHGIDIMCGIPDATEKELARDIETVTSLKPEHISVYLLTVESNTPLAKTVFNDDSFLEFQRQQLEFAMDMLSHKGYVHYEISNYCLSGYHSRHNMKYWTFHPYLGFGAGAHGFTGLVRYYNTQKVEEYIQFQQYQKDVRSQRAAMAEFLMTGLRLIEGFSEVNFEETFHTKLPDSIVVCLNELVRENLLRCWHEGNTRRYCLTREGICISDYVIYRCVEPLL
ncbi:MAG: radical SAM family heme chaperone HemW [Spirochaetes bacterium]|nr:radical SAM family heme chaperone HemW [Spirochaetota bacterium]